MLYSVILPTYNERENLPIMVYLLHKTLQDIQKDHPEVKLEIVIVDDNSPDKTLEVAQALQKSFGDKLIQIVSRSGKLGLGSAYKAGLQKSTGDRVILMDADMSHHPKFIPTMIQQMNENSYDIVTGSRYRKGGGVAGWDTYRKLTSRTANFLADFLLNPGVTDLTGSFRLYTREALNSILAQVQSTGYSFQMEIMVRARKASLQIGEVPITFVDRIYGESKLGTREIFLYLKGLLILFFTT